MPIKGKRFKKSAVSKEIEGLIRTFPTVNISVERAGFTKNTLQEELKIFQTIWRGDALVRKVSSTTQRLNMGPIETGAITILIIGRHDIREGDYVRMRQTPFWATNHPIPIVDKMYQIQRVNHPFETYMALELNMSQQQDSL